jgi:hypothetical protein
MSISDPFGSGVAIRRSGSDLLPFHKCNYGYDTKIECETCSPHKAAD